MQQSLGAPQSWDLGTGADGRAATREGRRGHATVAPKRAAALPLPGRLALVLLGTCAALAAGSLALRQNATPRPVWTDAQALRLADAQLAKLESAQAAAQRAVQSLQQQAQTLAQQASGLQELEQAAAAQAAGFGFEGADDRFARRRDGGGFG